MTGPRFSWLGQFWLLARHRRGYPMSIWSRLSSRGFSKSNHPNLQQPTCVSSKGFRLSYNPWATNFKGSPRTATLLQALCYGGLFSCACEVSRTQPESKGKGTVERDLVLKLQDHIKLFQVGALRMQAALDDLRRGPPTYATDAQLQEAIASLEAAFPAKGYIQYDPNSLLEAGASYSSYLPDVPHAVVVKPRTTEDVVQVVKISRKYRVPIVTSGGSTSFEGQFVGHQTGSICLDMSRMNKILDVNVEDSDLVCQAGASWEDINEELEDRGIPLFFPLDSGPSATIGGMLSTGCSGPNSTRYGSTQGEWFLNVTVVLPSGEVIKTRRRAHSSATGLDATKLFIGAEGTLGVVTEVTIRLAPVIPHTVAMTQFPNIEAASSAIRDILASPYGAHIQCAELLDRNMMQAIKCAKAIPNSRPVQDTVVFKVQGNADLIQSTSSAIRQIAAKYGSSHFEIASTEEQADNLWKNRKHVFLSTVLAHPGSQCWMTDVCVPPSQLPSLVEDTKIDLEKNGLRSVTVGRIGSGSFQTLVLFKGKEQYEAASAVVQRLEERAIALEGSCSGQHGIGLSKRHYLKDELGRGTLSLMHEIKHMLDPLHLMNPGKLLPDPSYFSCPRDRSS